MSEQHLKTPRSEPRRLQVEVYAHGGWWKDNTGRTGQVVDEQARKGPLATVAVVANGLGQHGWDLVDVVSAAHGVCRLSFETASRTERVGETGSDASGSVAMHLG